MKSLSRIVQLSLCGLLASAVTHVRADLAQDWFTGVAPATNSATGTSMAPQQLKFGHPAPPASVMTPQWQALLRRIDQVSEHKLQFKEYGSGTLIGPKDGFRAVRSGVAEFATCYVIYEGANFPLSKVFELPFVSSQSATVNTRIAFELSQKYLQPEFSKQEVLWAGAVAFAPTDIMSKKPIANLASLKGLKISAQGLPVEVAKEFGFTLVNIPYPDIYAALQQGVVDAVIWVDSGFIPYKIYEIAKHRTKLGFTGGSIPHCVNKEWYAKLPQAQQTAFARALEPSFVAAAAITQQDFAQQAEKTYADAGVQTHELSAADLRQMHERVEPILAEWVARNSQRGLPAAELLAEVKKLRAKYEPMSREELMKQSISSPVPILK